VGLYFFSPLFKGGVERAWENFSQWTPENIAKNPIGYLDFAEKQAKETMTSLKASEISLAQRKAKLDGMKEDADKKIAAGTAALGELKTTYSAAEEASSWPVEWRGEKRTRDFVRSQIKSLFAQVESQKGLVSKITTGLVQLDAQSNKLMEARAQLQRQLAEIGTNREMLRVNQITDEIKSQLVGINGALQATVASVGAGGDLVSLESLTAESETKVSDAEFDKIMGK
jgi:chromosome segregation ATPase